MTAYRRRPTVSLSLLRISRGRGSIRRDLIEEHADEFATLEALDNGKPVKVARAADIPLSADLFPLYGRLGDQDRRRRDPDLGTAGTG
jgi:acyl-CoA reductase-like NAD-dependent aldehyde dehydrogenase